ncbi:MAG: hypothetical protein JXX28_17560 [Deltaproteobacteria bacterium]|nr:hypothetical protein [Deltaproteobacteria bacterium]
MWWLLSVAMAASTGDAPLGDPSLWTERADALLAGPPGCWELVGRAVWDHQVGRRGGVEGAAVFVGRLEDGVWSELWVRPDGERSWTARDPGEVSYGDSAHFAPLIGAGRGGSLSVGVSGEGVQVDAQRRGDGDPVNGLRHLLEALEGGVETSDVWRDPAREGVVLHRDLALRRGSAPAVIEAFFPGEATQPAAVDYRFPERMSVNGVPSVVLRGAEVRLRGRVQDGVLLPVAEAVRGTATMLGMELAFAQTVTYLSAVACQAP